MTTPEILKYKVITIHLLSWIIGSIAFAVLTLAEVEVAMWFCIAAGLAALVSSVAVIPIAIIYLFQHRDESLRVKLQFAGAACLAALVLVGFLTFRIMTEGRH